MDELTPERKPVAEQLKTKVAVAVVEAAATKFCISGDFAEFVGYRERVPWKLAKKKSWWEVEIDKRNARRIRAMIGPGKFVYQKDEKGREVGPIVAMEVDASMQPATPQEHDIFEAIAKHHDGGIVASVDLVVEKGVLMAKFTVPVPELEPVGGRIILKSDADAQRTAEAKAAADKAKAEEEHEKQLAADAAKAQKVQHDKLIKTAAQAGAAAAAEVLKQSQK